jgi:hypothetical protein
MVISDPLLDLSSSFKGLVLPLEPPGKDRSRLPKFKGLVEIFVKNCGTLATTLEKPSNQLMNENSFDRYRGSA